MIPAQAPPNALTTEAPSRLGCGRGLIRALVGWVVLCAGIGIAISLARFFAELFAAPQAVVAAIQAALVTALVVPSVVLLRRRVDRRSVAGLGLSKRVSLPIALGLGIAVLGAALAWVPALTAGWIRFDSIDLGAFALFLVINFVVVFLYEALPEELALRGYAWSNIRDGWSPFATSLIVTVIFTLSSALISVIQTGSALLLRVEAQGFSLVPAGNDTFAYFLQLFLFGLALSAARRIPIPGALVIAIAFHVTQLTITRILLGGLGWINSGVETTFLEPDAIALVLVHILLSGLTFLAIRIWLTRRTVESPRPAPIQP